MDFLILMDGDTGVEALAGRAKVVHSGSSRLHIIRPHSATMAELASIPGIVALTAGKLPLEHQQTLNQQEALFAAAFGSRRTPKDRVGEGLPWDAPGFEPPDPPIDNPSNPTRRKKHHDQ